MKYLHAYVNALVTCIYYHKIIRILFVIIIVFIHVFKFTLYIIRCIHIFYIYVFLTPTDKIKREMLSKETIDLYIFF